MLLTDLLTEWLSDKLLELLELLFATKNIAEQYNIIQYSTVQYSTVKYSTLECSTVQHCTWAPACIWSSPPASCGGRGRGPAGSRSWAGSTRPRHNHPGNVLIEFSDCLYSSHSHYSPTAPAGEVCHRRPAGLAAGSAGGRCWSRQWRWSAGATPASAPSWNWNEISIRSYQGWKCLKPIIFPKCSQNTSGNWLVTDKLKELLELLPATEN